MSTLVAPVPEDAPRWPALIPPVLIAIPVALKFAGVPLNNAWIIFALLFGLLAGATFTIIVGTLGATFVWDIAHTDSVSPDLEVPKWIVYLCIPLGSYLMCFRFLQVAWSFWRTGELPHHDVAHVEGIEAEDLNLAAAPDLTPADVGSRGRS